MLRYIHVADNGMIDALDDDVGGSIVDASGAMRSTRGTTMRCAKCRCLFLRNEQSSRIEQKMLQALKEGDVALRAFEEVFVVYDPGPKRATSPAVQRNGAPAPAPEEVAYAFFLMAAIALWSTLLYRLFANGFSDTALAWDVTIALLGVGAILLARTYFRRTPRRI